MLVDKRLTATEKKKIKPAKQGGGMNYLGKQETVTVPKKWLSSPDHVVAELAYITPREQKILLDANIYGSLKGKPNKGPGGIMSLQGDMGSIGGGTGPGPGGGDRPNPHTVSGTSKATTPSKSPKSYDGPGNIHVDDPNAPEAYEIIGGQKYDVTPDTKKERELARTKQAILDAPVPNFTPKGIEYYKDGLKIGFAPTQKKSKFGFFKDVVVPLGLAMVNPTLATKYGKAKSLYNAAQFAGNLAQTFGITNTNVVDSFVSGLTDRTTKTSKSKTKNTKDIDDDRNGGDGLGSTSEMNALRDEYYLLLQKLKAGNILAGERNRLTALKNLLGMA